MAPNKDERRRIERDQRRRTQSEGSGNGALVVLLLGIGGVLFSLSMDTSVPTGLGRVNNLGLMNQQQNYLIVSALVAIVGAILMLRERSRNDSRQGDEAGPHMKPAAEASGKRCPDCAETVKRDAKVCRFCGNRDFPDERQIP